MYSSGNEKKSGNSENEERGIPRAILKWNDASFSILFSFFGGDFMGDFFGNGGGRGGERDVARGADIVMELWVTLEELYVGNFVEVSIWCYFFIIC